MMRRLAHLSDLHFGRPDATVVDALSRTLVVERPDLVVISGDFTQRARRGQFRAAGAFLAGLHAAGLRTLYVTPGRQKLSHGELVAQPPAGALFALHVRTPGLPVPRFAGSV
jgi:3',5'-cyclic AMP phosphodiesterase CpdA